MNGDEPLEEGWTLRLELDFGFLDRLRLLLRGHVDIETLLWLPENTPREYETPDVSVRHVWEDTGTELLLEERPWEPEEDEGEE